jgi:hypothetical protein
MNMTAKNREGKCERQKTENKLEDVKKFQR